MNRQLVVRLMMLVMIGTLVVIAAQSLQAAPPPLYAASSKVYLPLITRSGGGSGIPGNGPTFAGCPMFPANNVWNARIDSLPVDPKSAAYVSAMGANLPIVPNYGPTYNGGIYNGFPYNLVPGTQPPVNITFDYYKESDPGPYPIPSSPVIESGSDAHLLILDTGHCVLYETWNTRYNGGWQAGSGAKWNLNSNALRPITWTSADAAGLSMLPGMVRYDEVAAGEIRHALRFNVDGTNDQYVWPARHATYHNYSANNPPMGQRFRLKASFDISSFSPQVQVVLTALKRYGMMVSDNGGPWFISGTADQRWNYALFYREFQRVHGSDFEAVDESSLMLDPNSGQVK